MKSNHIYLSKETNEIQRVISLRQSRNKRFRHQEFIIEGTSAIEQAFAQNWEIKSVFYHAEAKLSDWAQDYINKPQVDNVYAVSSMLMEKITDRTDTPEMIVIGKARTADFSSYKAKANDVIIVLDQPNSPGNLGMIIRSAVAFGAAAIIISGHAADEYDPKCIRSSVGTFFSIPIYRVGGASEFLATLETKNSRKNMCIISSGNNGVDEMEAIDFHTRPLCVILGNETYGVSKMYKECSDYFVKIPTLAGFSSLNIGVAASIFLYETYKT